MRDLSMRKILVGSRTWGIAAAVIGALTALGGYIIVNRLEQNPPGYCDAQKRYIADEEFIRTAIALYEWEMNRDRILQPGGTISKRKDDHKDEYRIWEQSRNQTECCHVYRAETQSIINRLFGLQKIEVTLYLNPKSRGDSQLSFAFDACGKLLPHEFGYRLPDRYGITTSNYQEFISNNQ
jgi:hypothetical protein